jgi:hypothetical protein
MSSDDEAAAPRPPGTESAGDRDYNPYQAPRVVEDAPVTPPVSTGQPRAARIAGGLMLAAAAVAMLSNPRHRALGLLIDGWIGGSLLAGKDKVRGFAIVRVVLGALFFGGTAVAKGQVAEAVLVVILSASFLLLLVGRPGKASTVAGTIGCGLVLLLRLLSLLMPAS